MFTQKKILVLRNFTVEPTLNELEDKLLKKNIKCKFDISTYDSSINEVLKFKKKKIDEYNAVLALFSLELFIQKQKNLDIALKNFKKSIFDLSHILTQKKFFLKSWVRNQKIGGTGGGGSRKSPRTDLRITENSKVKME